MATPDNGAVSARRERGTIILALYTETPLHPGTGQSAGIVDLPVQREAHTGFPLVPATGLKGSFREEAEARWGRGSDTVNTLFGPEQRGDVPLYAGALSFTEGRLLAFPVRSTHEVFLWATSPLALGRLERTLRLSGDSPPLSDVRTLRPEEEEMIVGDALPGPVVLEDLSFRATRHHQWAQVAQTLSGYLPAGEAHAAYREKFARHLVLVDDTSFGYLVRNATQVAARIALDERKTSANLWYEESIPVDTLLYTLVYAESPRVSGGPIAGSDEVRARFLELVRGHPPFLQLGGNETVGYGWCALRVHPGERHA